MLPRLVVYQLYFSKYYISKKQFRSHLVHVGTNLFYIHYLDISCMLDVRNEMLLLFLDSFQDLRTLWSRLFFMYNLILMSNLSALNDLQKIINILFIIILCLYSLTHLFIHQILSTFYDPGTVLGTRDTKMPLQLYCPKLSSQ